MDLIVTILFGALALYMAIGLVVAPAFVIFGLTAMHAAATLGARILFLPGAVALWPIVLSHWLKARNAA